MLKIQKSFEKERYTCNSLFEKFGQIPFILVGYNSELEPQISQEEILKFALEYQCEYIKISNKYFNLEIILDVFNNNLLYEAFQECYCRLAQNTNSIQIFNQEYQQKRSCF